MRRIFIFTSILLSVLGWAFASYHGGDAHAKGSGDSTRKNETSKSAKHLDTQSLHESLEMASGLSGLESDSPEIANLEEEISSELQALSEKLQSEGMTEKQLQDVLGEFSDSGEGSVLSRLPQSLQGDFKNLYSKIHQLQDLVLEEDGKDRAFFQTEAQDTAPNEVAFHALELERLPVSPGVDRFIELKSRAPEISDGDISKVADLCGRQWDCIEKSAYEWIKAGHQLTESQLQMVSGFKTGG